MSDAMTPTMPHEGDVWLHHKGARYIVVGAAYETSSGEPVVIYKPESGPEAAGRLWVRRLGEFLGFTEDHRPRFILLDRINAGGSNG